MWFSCNNPNFLGKVVAGIAEQNSEVGFRVWGAGTLGIGPGCHYERYKCHTGLGDPLWAGKETCFPAVGSFQFPSTGHRFEEHLESLCLPEGSHSTFIQMSLQQS